MDYIESIAVATDSQLLQYQPYLSLKFFGAISGVERCSRPALALAEAHEQLSNVVRAGDPLDALSDSAAAVAIPSASLGRAALISIERR